MPKFIPEERKAKISKRYQELVEELNGFIDDKNLKLNQDDNFELYLDFPNTVESYNIAKEMEEMKNKQHQILDSFASKSPLKNEDDRKWLVCAIKSEDSPYAKAYNDKLYKDYQANPDKVKAMLFRKVMTFDPRQIMKCDDKNVELLRFYKENHEVVDLADVLANSNGAPFYEGQNKDFVKALEQMSEPLNVIAYPKRLALHATTDDFFAMPYMNDEQAKAIVLGADKKGHEFPNYVRDTLESMAGGDITVTPKAYFASIYDKNPATNLDSSFLSSYIAKQKDHPNEKDVSDFSEYIKDNSIDVYHRPEIESFRIRSINPEYEKAYQKNWLKFFNIENNVKEDTSIQETLSKHKGGFMERLFSTTSKEYKEYEKALEDYHNPKSIYYLNDKNLHIKSQAYLVHKGGKGGRIDLDKLDPTSRKRVELVRNTVQNLEQSKSFEKETEKSLEQGYPVQGKAFLSEKDVSEENEIKDNNIIQKGIVNENIIEMDDVKM